MATSLTNAGQARFLKQTLMGVAPPTNFKIGLTNAALTKTSDLAAAVAGEPSAGGYARVTLEQSATGWPTEGLDAGDDMLTSKACDFVASGGDIGPFARAFLTDETDLLAWWDTAQTSVVDGNTFSFVAKIKLI